MQVVIVIAGPPFVRQWHKRGAAKRGVGAQRLMSGGKGLHYSQVF